MEPGIVEISRGGAGFRVRLDPRSTKARCHNGVSATQEGE